MAASKPELLSFRVLGLGVLALGFGGLGFTV